MTSMTDPRPTPDWRPLALTLAGMTAAYAVVYRLMPFDMRGYFLWPFGAWALYSGSHIPPNYVFYLCLGASVLIGRALLRRTQNPVPVVTGALASYAFFFLVSNFAAWL